MSVIVDKADAERAVEILRENGEDAYVMGEVITGSQGVVIE